MVEALIKKIHRLLPGLLLFGLPFTGRAHQLDEYLQSTLVVVQPTDIRLEINLTPGVAISEQVLALIDPNHDGIVSTNEAVAYAQLLKRDLVARLDQHDVELVLTAFDYPTPAELRTGWGIIQLEFIIPTPHLSAGTHHFILEDRHLPAISVYLFNAEKSMSDELQITGQTRSKTQSKGEITFAFNPPLNLYEKLGVYGAYIAVIVVVLGVINQTRKYLIFKKTPEQSFLLIRPSRQGKVEDIEPRKNAGQYRPQN